MQNLANGSMPLKQLKNEQLIDFNVFDRYIYRRLE